MRLPIAACIAALVTACVAEPKVPAFLDQSSPISEACSPNSPCDFPPIDFNLTLLPAVKTNVDAGDDPDLIIPNAPDSSDEWGFFVIYNMGAQTGVLRAGLFVPTDVKPEACHVEARTAAVGARVFLFGSDTSANSSVEIYKFNSAVNTFEKEVGGQETPLSLPSSDDPPVLTAGHFDSSAPLNIPDVVVGVGSDLYTLSCGATECDDHLEPLELAASSTAEAPIPDDNLIRFLEPRLAPVATSSLYSFQPFGLHDLVVAAEGAIRWYSYASSLPDDGDAKWRSFTEFEPSTFQPGVMGTLTAAASGPLVQGASDPADLVLGGYQALDLTDIQRVDLTGRTPGSRYKWERAAGYLIETQVVGTVVGNIGNDSMPDLFIAGLNNTSLRLAWLKDVRITRVGDLEGAGDFDTEEPLELPIELGPGLRSVGVSAIAGRLWLFSESGDCAIYELDEMGLGPSDSLDCAL